MAQRMSDLDCIINLEIPVFAEAVQKLPEDIGRDIHTVVLNALVGTVDVVILSKGKEVIAPKFLVLEEYEGYEEPVTLALELGERLCERAARYVSSSSNREEDYKKLLAHYFKNFEHFADKKRLKNSSFSEYVDS